MKFLTVTSLLVALVALTGCGGGGASLAPKPPVACVPPVHAVPAASVLGGTLEYAGRVPTAINPSTISLWFSTASNPAPSGFVPAPPDLVAKVYLDTAYPYSTGSPAFWFASDPSCAGYLNAAASVARSAR